ncbi:MAG TPA: anthranilate phosphoribosyltransferase, partial [Chloroflexi bacterium]|nr:anthranilate phosphoribosyltransferase [Chloroflexota bacterium]
VLKELGCKSAMVIHSNDGLDELTISGLNKITHLKPDGNISSFDLVASDLGLESQPSETITGGSISKNLQILREILSGKSSNLLSNTVVLNAAAAMATIDGNIKNKIDEARTVLLSGAALNTLDKLVTISQKLSSNT